MTANISRPNTPARAALTLNAKNALASAAYDLRTMHRYIGAVWSVAAGAELLRLQLVDDHGVDRKLGSRYSVNASGDVMRDYVIRDRALRALGRVATEQGITGEDLADVAAAVDAGQDECVGVSRVFYLAFLSRSEIDGTSGQDLLQDVVRVLGW